MEGIETNLGLRNRKLLLNTMSEKASLRKEIQRENAWAIPRTEKSLFSRQGKQHSKQRGDGGKDHTLRPHLLKSCEPWFLVLVFSECKGKTFSWIV